MTFHRVVKAEEKLLGRLRLHRDAGVYAIELRWIGSGEVIGALGLYWLEYLAACFQILVETSWSFVKVSISVSQYYNCYPISTALVYLAVYFLFRSHATTPTKS